MILLFEIQNTPDFANPFYYNSTLPIQTKKEIPLTWKGESPNQLQTSLPSPVESPARVSGLVSENN